MFETLIEVANSPWVRALAAAILLLIAFIALRVLLWTSKAIHQFNRAKKYHPELLVPDQPVMLLRVYPDGSGQFIARMQRSWYRVDQIMRC